MADDTYQERIRELQKYAPFLENTIKRLRNETGKLREAQISKLQSLLVILTDPKKKLKFDALKKCEEVILKLYDKVEKKSPTDKMQKYMCRTPPEDKVYEEQLPVVDDVTFSVARQKLCKQVKLTSANSPLLATPTEKVECQPERIEFNNILPTYNDNKNPNDTLNWSSNSFNQQVENHNNHPLFSPQNQNWGNEQLYFRRNEIQRQERKTNRVWVSEHMGTTNKTMSGRESIVYSDDFGVDASALLEDIPIFSKITPTQTRVKEDRIVQEYLEKQNNKQLLKNPSPPKLNKPPLSESDLQNLFYSAPSSSEQSRLLNENMDLNKLEELKAKLCRELEESTEKNDSVKVRKTFPVMVPKPKPKVVELKVVERVVKEHNNIFGDLLSSIDEQIMNKNLKKPEKKEVNNVTDKNKKDIKPKEKYEIQENKTKIEVPKEKKEETKESKKQEPKNNPKDISKSKEKEIKTKVIKDTTCKEKEIKTKDIKDTCKEEEIKTKDIKDKKCKEKEIKIKDIKDTKGKENEIKTNDIKDTKCKESEIKTKDIKDPNCKEKEMKINDIKDTKCKENEIKTKDIKDDIKCKENEIKTKDIKDDIKCKENEIKTKDTKDPKYKEKEIRTKDVKDTKCKENEIKTKDIKHPKCKEKEMKIKDIKDTKCKENEIKTKDIKDDKKCKENEIKTKDIQDPKYKEKEMKTRDVNYIKYKETEVKTKDIKDPKCEEKETKTKNVKDPKCKEKEIKTKDIKDTKCKENEIKIKDIKDTKCKENEIKTKDIKDSKSKENEMKTKHIKETKCKEKEIKTKPSESKPQDIEVNRKENKENNSKKDADSKPKSKDTKLESKFKSEPNKETKSKLEIKKEDSKKEKQIELKKEAKSVKTKCDKQVKTDKSRRPSVQNSEEKCKPTVEIKTEKKDKIEISLIDKIIKELKDSIKERKVEPQKETKQEDKVTNTGRLSDKYPHKRKPSLETSISIEESAKIPSPAKPVPEDIFPKKPLTIVHPCNVHDPRLRNVPFSPPPVEKTTPMCNLANKLSEPISKPMPFSPPTDLNTENRTLIDPFMGNMTPNNPFSGNMTSNNTFLGNMTPGDPLLENKTPTDPFVGNRAPCDSFCDNRTLSDSFFGNRMPNDLLLSNRTPNESYVASRTPVDLFSTKYDVDMREMQCRNIFNNQNDQFRPNQNQFRPSRPESEQFRTNPEQFRHQNQFRPGLEQFRRQGTEQFRQIRPNWDPGRYPEQSRPEMECFQGNPIYFRTNQEQIRHGDNFRPNKEQFRQNFNKFRPHEEQFRHSFNPRLPNTAPRLLYQNSTQNFSPYDLSQIKPVDFFEKEDQSHGRRNSEEFHNQRRNHNQIPQSVQRVNPIVRGNRRDNPRDDRGPPRNRNEDERRTRNESRFLQEDPRRPRFEEKTAHQQTEPKREYTGKKSFEDPKEPIPELIEPKPKDYSPLDSLYSSLSKPFVGIGYGIQNFRIPKKHKPEKPETKEEKKENIKTNEEAKPVEVKVNIEKSTEDIKGEEVKQDNKEEKSEAIVLNENIEAPKTEADEKLDTFNKFMKHIFDTCDSSFLLQYLDKCGTSISKSKTKRIRRIIDSDSESNEEEVREEVKEVKESENKKMQDDKVEEPAPIIEPEQKTPEKKPPTKENSEVIETVEERIKNRRRKQLLYSSDSSPEKLASPAQDTRVTGKTAKENIPKTKRKNTLELLQEDIREMFLSEGVLTATGKRMCRMMTEHQEQEIYNNLQDSKSKPKEDVVTDDDDVLLLIKYTNMKKKMKQDKNEEPVEEAKENELPQKSLRSSPRVLLEKVNFPPLKSPDEENYIDEKGKKDEITFAAPEAPVKTKKTRREKVSRKRYSLKRRMDRSLSASSSQSTLDSTIDSETTDAETVDTETTEVETFESATDVTTDAETVDTETTEVETFESATEVETAEFEEKSQQKKQLRKRKSRTQTIESETTTAETVESLPETETAECENKQNENPIKKKETTEVKTVERSAGQTTDSEGKRKGNSVKIIESEIDEEMCVLETAEAEKPENKRPVRKRNSVKIIESEIDEEKLEAELDKTDKKDKSEKKKPIKKRKNNWAHGVIPREKKRKVKKADRSASSLSMNLEISDQMSVTESVNEGANVAEIEEQQPTSQNSEEEYALFQIDIKPDRNYYFDNRTSFDCKLCDYKGKFIVHHYRTRHTESETMISRLSPNEAKNAQSEAMLKKFDEIEPYEEVANGRKKRTRYICRFCGFVFRLETSITFLDHICSHTGEYRYYCELCSFISANRKVLSSHCYNTHPELKKPLTIKTKWPSPPNFRIVFGYLCKACNFIQLLKTNVEQHIKVSHVGENVGIIKISMSSKPVHLQGLRSPNEGKEKVEDNPEEDKNKEFKEKTSELEPEPVKEKKLDMTVFLESGDISLKEQLIEAEKRKSMEEIASNITTRRSTFQFVDQLKKKLHSANSINNQLETTEPEVIACEIPMDIENHTIKILNEETTNEVLTSQDFRFQISSTISLAETDPEADEDNKIEIASTCSTVGLESSETENEKSQINSEDLTEVPGDEEKELYISEEEIDIINVELDITKDSKQKEVMDTIQRLAAKLQNPKMPQPISTDVEETEVKPEIIETDIREQEEIYTMQEKKEESGDIQKVINVGAIEVRIQNKEQTYICKIQDCHFKSSYKISFTKHCSEAHNLTVLCEICARENNFIYFTMTSLFVHLFDAHKSNAKIVPSAKIRIRRISGDLLSKQPAPDLLQNIADPIIETIEVHQQPVEQSIGFLQIKDVRTLTEEEEHNLQSKSPQRNSQESFTTPPIQIAPNLAIISNLQSDIQIVQEETPQNMKQITTINSVSTSTGRKVIQTKTVMIPIHELPEYVTMKQTITHKQPTDTNILPSQKATVVLPYKCTQDNCNQNFLVADDFMVHLHLCHKMYFTCGICDDKSLYFITALALIQHYVIHNIARYQCPYCVCGKRTMWSLFSHHTKKHPHLEPVCYIRQAKEKKNLPESVDDLVTMHMELKCPVEALNTIKQSTCTTPTQKSSTENFSSPTVTTTILEEQNLSYPAAELAQPIADLVVANVAADSPSVNFNNAVKDTDVIDVDDVQFNEPYVTLKHKNVESKKVVDNAVDPLIVYEKSNESAEIVDLEQEVQPEIVDLVQDFFVCGTNNCMFSSDSLKQFRNHLYVCDVFCNSYICSICYLKFMTVDGLCDHYITHREKRFSCGLCDNKELFKHQILEHVKEVHNISRPKISPVDPNKRNLKVDYFTAKPREKKQDYNTLKTILESPCKMTSSPTLLFSPDTEKETRFTCNICTYKSTQPNIFLQHMKEAHQNQYMQFDPVDKNKEDLSKDHFTVKPITCSLSENTRNTFGPEDMDSLPRESVYKSEIKCKRCNYITKVRSNMQRHLQQHIGVQTVSETAPVYPVPCLEKNERMFTATSHYERMDEKAAEKSDKVGSNDNLYPEFIPSSRRFVCGAVNCNYLTHGDQMFRHHLTALHSDELIYKCPHCQIEIPTEIDGLEIDQILFHFKMHDTHLYKCPNCEFLHYQKHKIERHISDNHPDENKNVIVIREYDYSTNLKDDRSALPADFIESGFKFWRCGYCSYKCQSKNEIQNHSSTQHGLKSQFKCAKCKFTCSSKTIFTVHFKKFHPDTPEPEINTVYYKTTEEEARASQEELNEPFSFQPEFDTTALWMKNRTGAKNSQGILVEETKSSPKRMSEIIEKLQEIGSQLEDTSKVENVTRNLFLEPKESKKFIQDSQKSQQNFIFNFPNNYGSAQENFYRCPSCESFKTRSVKEFTEHLYAEMNYYRCACSLCGQRFIDLAMAKQHWLLYHSTESPEEQLTPLTSDAKVENWVDHCILHQTKMLRKDESDVTSENTSESSSLDLADSASSSKLKCEFCDYMAKNRKTLRKHQKRHKSYFQFKCDYCDYKALTIERIKNHHCVKHKFGELSYSIVPTQLDENNSLKRKRSENEDNSSNPTKLLLHGEPNVEVITELDVIEIDETTDDMQTFYGCFYCSKKSELLHIIRKHFFDIHPENGPFKYKKVNVNKNKKQQHKCNYCNWLGDKNALRLHYLKSHEDQAETKQRNTKLKCSLCAVMYSKVKQMKKHFIKKHPLKNLTFCVLLDDGTILDSTEFREEKDVAIKCKYCADQFENKDDLLNHHTLLHSHLEFEKEDDLKPKKCKIKRTNTADLDEPPAKILVIDDDLALSVKQNVAKKSTALPALSDHMTKKSTTNIPKCLEFSYYGTKPSDISNYKNVMSEINIMGKVMPISVVAMSHVLNLFPVVPLVDIKKTV